MSLTELMLVVGLWAIWLGALLLLLHGLGRAARPSLGASPSRSARGARCS